MTLPLKQNNFCFISSYLLNYNLFNKLCSFFGLLSDLNVFNYSPIWSIIIIIFTKKKK